MYISQRGVHLVHMLLEAASNSKLPRKGVSTWCTCVIRGGVEQQFASQSGVRLVHICYERQRRTAICLAKWCPFGAYVLLEAASNSNSPRKGVSTWCICVIRGGVEQQSALPLQRGVHVVHASLEASTSNLRHKEMLVCTS